MNQETLSALTRGIQHAASSTFNMLAQQYLGLLGQFFDEGPDKKLVAKMVYVRIDEAHSVTVPLIALVAPRGLALDKMRVSMSVRIDETELKQATSEADNLVADRTSMRVTVSPRTRDGARRPTDVTDLEMEFAAGEPPESIMRIIDTFANQIDPKLSTQLEPDLKRYPPASLVYKPKEDGPLGHGPGTAPT